MRDDETDVRGTSVRSGTVRSGTVRPTPARPSSDLTERDRLLLDFEQDAPASPARKEAAIRSELGLSAPRYQQLLGALIEKPAALAYAPMLVGRLLRLRDSRKDARSARTFGR